MTHKNKIVISVNTAWNIYNFRAGLVGAFIEKGYEVIAVTPTDQYSQRLKELGCKHICLPMDNHGTHLGRDLLLFVRYWLLLRSERPVAYLGYTVKPNIYGSLAAHLLSIPVINNIAGLGATFITQSFLTKIVKVLYRIGLYRSFRVFFQNRDDQELFIASKLVRSEITDLVPGSGINLKRYSPSPPLPIEGRSFRFLLIARVLKDKGIVEYAEAARTVRRHFPDVQFQLLGPIDEKNPNAISLSQITAWCNEGIINYLGETADVRPFLASADCVVLPSYREGVPRSLLEAAAMARPIIATNSVGCRDAVDDGFNGLFCNVKDADSLAETMLEMIQFPQEHRLAMGNAGRRKVESEFDEKIVLAKYLEVIRQIENR